MTFAGGLISRRQDQKTALEAGPQPRSAGNFAMYLPDDRYRSKWYIDNGDGPLLLRLDITCSSTPNGT
jgi:hypothetical protein